MISKRKSFIVGLKSTKLSNNEILFLKKNKPWGIILFTRNIKSFDQVKKLSEWPKCIDVASTKLEPHRIPVYLYDLASEFHSYWNLGKQFPEKRFINDQKTVSPDKLIFLKAISNVIKTGMDIVGVDTPNQM